MRFLLVATFALSLATFLGCDAATPDMPTLDAGMTTPPDLSPIALPVEPIAPTFPDATCPINHPAAPDLLDEALSVIGLTRCTYAFGKSYTSTYPTDAYKLPFFAWAHDHPVNAPSFARTTITRLDDAAKSATPIANQLVLLGDRLGPPLTVTVPQFAADPFQPLAAAVAQLITDKGGTPDMDSLVADAADIPADLQVAMAALILAVDTADSDWNTLMTGISSDDQDTLSGTGAFVLAGASGSADPSVAATRKLLSKTWNEQALVTGAARLAAAIESAGLARFANTKGYVFDQATPIGRIGIYDAHDNDYPEDGSDAFALLVDTGGDDTYEKAVGAVGGPEWAGPNKNPIHVAVAIDLAGADSYGYLVQASNLDGKRLPSDSDGRNGNPPISLSDQPRQGGARLGYGFLFDLGTEGDHYRSLRMSQGFGVAGVGVLYDAGGDDTYEGEAGVQGGGIFGVGILFDAKGNDTYRCYAEAEGFGYTRGAGLLYDAEGNDQYLSDNGEPRLGGDPIYTSPQLPCTTKDAMGNRLDCGNSSFTQGAGFGMRAASASGNMSGGLGILRDLTGDDVYVTSVFGQGTGYMAGTGILADGAGNDSYDGFWYIQGSDAHNALCVFMDDAGDDKYNQSWPAFPPYATSTGQGHDFSVGWHLDLGGNDLYREPNLSLGSGNANGAGALINMGGTDTFVCSSPFTLGGAQSDPTFGQPATVPTFGLFVHTGANPTYTVPMDPRLTPQPAAGATWSFKGDLPATGIVDLSVGVDRPTGTVSLP